jgi:hypothetical protein
VGALLITGLAVGWNVGIEEGLAVDGALVGRAEGCGDGRTEGIAVVGRAVGSGTGAFEGDRDGREDAEEISPNCATTIHKNSTPHKNIFVSLS